MSKKYRSRELKEGIRTTNWLQMSFELIEEI